MKTIAQIIALPAASSPSPGGEGRGEGGQSAPVRGEGGRFIILVANVPIRLNTSGILVGVGRARALQFTTEAAAFLFAKNRRLQLGQFTVEKF